MTGRPFSQLVQEELVRPLRLDGMYVGAPDEALARAAKLIWQRRALPGVELLGPESGIVGDVAAGSATALRWALRGVGVDLDLISILDALAPRGISAFDFSADRTLRAAIPAANGLFTARALARMYAALAAGGEIDGVRLLSRRTLARATQVQRPTRRRVVLPFDMRWRLGYHAVATTRGVPRHAFGHFGFGGSGGWADPRRQLAVALIVNGGLGMPLGDLRIARISGAALAGAGRRPSVSAGRARRRQSPRPSPLLVQVLDALNVF